MRKHTILIVEDDVPLRKQLRFSFERSYNVLEASLRIEAERTLKKGCVDVAIIDLGLPPEEDSPQEGLKLIKHITELYPKTKVIVLTGQKTEEAAKESVKSGAFDYILKPTNPETLISSAERALFFKTMEEKLEKEGIKKVSFTTKLGKGVKEAREEAEKQLIIKVLNDTGFNVYRASKILGIKRENLYYFMKKFGIKRTDED